MNTEWRRRLTWVAIHEFDSAFLSTPFPERAHRGCLASLRDSIARVGVIQPLIARVVGGRLQVICGYRRWLAAQLAAVSSVPVLVIRASDAESKRIFEEENAVEWQSREDARVVVETQATDVTERNGRSAGPEDVEDDTEIVETDSPSALDMVERQLDSLYDETVEIFKTSRRDKCVPTEPTRGLIDRLLTLRPISNGVDIRNVGGHVEPGADALSGIAAHSLRVAILAQHFGERMSWAESATGGLTLAGFVHDVGMLAVPEDLLQSSYPLTRERRKAIELHTRLGRAMLHLDWPKSIANVARDHHERWDGTGYPGGKHSRSIGNAAHIIGMLDSYAAMICRRSYRQSYLVGEAIRLLDESTAVGRFDPVLLDQFRQVFSRVPVGSYGVLSDGRRVRVRSVRSDSEKSHLLEVAQTSARVHDDLDLWYSEEQLAAQLTECNPPPCAVRAFSGGRQLV